MERQPNTQYILSLSYGKDSLACLAAIEQLGWPLDRIVHSEVWATNTIPADLPPMIEFKKKADKIIKERYGIEVEHTRAKRTYEERFYTVRTEKAKKRPGMIYGWPFSVPGAWCNSDVKMPPLKAVEMNRTAFIACQIQKKSPLIAIGWDEAYCRKWCEENDLLSPIYTTATRGGCWFCHNQPIDQLRLLRKNYPEYWQLLLKWDSDSPVTFKADGHTVHDYDKRFEMEELGLVPTDRKFRWKMLKEDYH